MRKKYFIIRMAMAVYLALSSLPSWAQPSTLTAKPMKSALNGIRKAPNRNVWYTKPEGTFYKNAYPTSSLVVPPLTQLTFQNQSADIAASSWSLNGETQGVGLPSFQASYPAMREDVLFPVPQISVGTDTFALGRTAADKGYIDGHIATTDSINHLSKTDYVTGGSYIGWSDCPGFPFKGKRDLNGDGKEEDFVFHSLVQHYYKPATPFYLSALTIPFSSYQIGKDMIPEGKEVTVRIDVKEVGNTIATGHITKADIDQTKWTEDELFTYAGPTVTFDEGPLVIADEFYIVVEGLEECEQMGFWTTLPEAYEQETEEHRTRNEGYDEEGNYKFTTWANTSGNTTTYWEAIIYLVGMFDVAEIDATLTTINAPAEGGVVTMTYAGDGEDVTDNALVLRSSRSFMDDKGTANYEIEGLPDWLKIQSIEEITDTEDRLTRITLAAEPYNGPTPKGREVSLRIRSEYGACTQSVTIQQIPMVGDSFTILSEDNKNIRFTITDTEDYACEVTNIDIAEDGKIAIPASIWGFEVVGIAEQAFADRNDLTDITIDFGNNSYGGNIGKEAFKGCTNLRNVTIGENTRSIGDYTFAGCGNTETIKSLVNIDNLWSFDDNVFDASIYENATLIVPNGRVEQYKETLGWSNFRHIMDEETAAGIIMTQATTPDNATEIYLLDGSRTDKARRGINIIRTDDRTVKILK